MIASADRRRFLLRGAAVGAATAPSWFAPPAVALGRRAGATIEITAHGAVGDGRTLNTAAIQRAVDAIHRRGGGRVIVPPGVFLTGTIELKSNVELHLVSGAVLKGSPRLSDYRGNGFIHSALGEVIAMITAIGQERISITGGGTIDFTGAAFMDYATPFNPAVLELGLSAQEMELTACAIRDRVNQPIFFHDCTNIAVRDVTLIEAPCWTLTCSLSRNIQIRGITILNNLRVPNSDGVHLCSCRDALIADCVFVCADDCIAITGITAWEDITERIVIANCIMRSHSAALRIGHESSKVRNVMASNLLIYGSNRGIGVFAGSEGGTPGFVRGVDIQNVQIETRMLPTDEWWGRGEPLVIAAFRPESRIEDVVISGVRVDTENAIVLSGAAASVSDVELRNWRVTLGRSPYRSRLGGEIDIKPAPMIPFPDGKRRLPWLFAQDVGAVRIEDVDVERRSGHDGEVDLAPEIRNSPRLALSAVRQG